MPKMYNVVLLTECNEPIYVPFGEVGRVIKREVPLGMLNTVYLNSVFPYLPDLYRCYLSISPEPF